MRTKLLCLVLLATISFNASGDVGQQINIEQKPKHGTHSELYPPADMPEVYYDDDNLGIIIVADGFASYYYVDIVSQSTQLAVFSTQIGGYGDAIDVSSLPDDDYTIYITSSNNNEYEGQFTNY